ncbi:Histone-lysine N-methyltransferase [Vigna angularis]|uniref:Histone-lysine N-methyltransferase n=1 Tax=Phaseolus angularis TaxID=3914 RepID=A0A8T0KY77_PHAAN|nr:Histone-lysine N-methyltransferase [Vigna angularis]
MEQPNYTYDLEDPIERNRGMVVWKMEHRQYNPIDKKYWVEEGAAHDQYCRKKLLGGALKPTDVEMLWVHVTCAWFRPQVVFQEHVLGIKHFIYLDIYEKIAMFYKNNRIGFFDCLIGLNSIAFFRYVASKYANSGLLNEKSDGGGGS